MPKESIKKEDIEQERTTKELLNWVESIIDRVATSEDGEKAIRLREEEKERQAVPAVGKNEWFTG